MMSYFYIQKNNELFLDENPYPEFLLKLKDKK